MLVKWDKPTIMEWPINNIEQLEMVILSQCLLCESSQSTLENLEKGAIKPQTWLGAIDMVQ